MKIKKIAIIGLGYVGLPLAVSLSKFFDVIGFDIKKNRVKDLNSGKDETNEVSTNILKKALSNKLKVTSSKRDINRCNVFIVTVPTPVTTDNKPDFEPLLKSCNMIGSFVKKNDIIIFESTVYPGATQDICGKKIEEVSGMKMEEDFFLGYSPERINPGDKIHTVEKITKVLAAENVRVTDVMKEIYSKLTSGNIFVAKNIKVAEASKVIENSQRDINIAFINEITMISNKLGISIYDVLEASQTKWNFLPFFPGLVGGHCIGVDPFYLAKKAKEVGIEPKVILSGRRTNDNMSKFISKEVNLRIKKKSNILILGLTFKENVPDIRNSKIFDLINYFESKSHKVFVCDPLVEHLKFNNIKFTNLKKIKKNFFDSIVLAVPHDYFINLPLLTFKKLLKKNGLAVDLRGIWIKKNFFENIWSM